MVYLSLGSNDGDRFSYLREAKKLLKKQCFLWLEESVVIETPALLKPGSPKSWDKPYLNMIIRGDTQLSVEQFFLELQAIEKTLGRPPCHPKWSPRTIDLDILLWGNQIIEKPELKIPHPELLNRFFLLHLIALLAPECRIPTQPEKTLLALVEERWPSGSFFTRSFVLEPKLVGVVNITPDSFSDGGLYFDPEAAINHIFKLHEEGATIIEIGAQSTRPGALFLSPEEEYLRLEPVLDAIKNHLSQHRLQLSLDSYHHSTILNVLKHYPIHWVNDVKGALPLNILSDISGCGAGLISMHSVTIPPSQQQKITQLDEVDHWAESTLEKLKPCGFSQDRVILDPGIGFGKSIYQSLQLIQKIQSLKKFQCPLLVGHSRKSFMSAFTTVATPERDIETLAISDYLYSCGVEYLRVHDVASHQRFWVSKSIVARMQNQ